MIFRKGSACWLLPALAFSMPVYSQIILESALSDPAAYCQQLAMEVKTDGQESGQMHGRVTFLDKVQIKMFNSCLDDLRESAKKLAEVNMSAEKAGYLRIVDVQEEQTVIPAVQAEPVVKEVIQLPTITAEDLKALSDKITYPTEITIPRLTVPSVDKQSAKADEKQKAKKADSQQAMKTKQSLVTKEPLEIPINMGGVSVTLNRVELEIYNGGLAYVGKIGVGNKISEATVVISTGKTQRVENVRPGTIISGWRVERITDDHLRLVLLKNKMFPHVVFYSRGL